MLRKRQQNAHLAASSTDASAVCSGMISDSTEPPGSPVLHRNARRGQRACNSACSAVASQITTDTTSTALSQIGVISTSIRNACTPSCPITPPLSDSGFKVVSDSPSDTREHLELSDGSEPWKPRHKTKGEIPDSSRSGTSAITGNDTATSKGSTRNEATHYAKTKRVGTRFRKKPRKSAFNQKRRMNPNLLSDTATKDADCIHFNQGIFSEVDPDPLSVFTLKDGTKIDRKERHRRRPHQQEGPMLAEYYKAMLIQGGR